MKDLKATLDLYLCAGGAQQHRVRVSRNQTLHEQVCKVSGWFMRWIFCFLWGAPKAESSSSVQVLAVLLFLAWKLSSAHPTASRLHQLCASHWRFFLSFIQMNIKWTSILGCKWTQVQMNGFQLATPACCRSDNSARFPPLLHAWLRLPALISNLFMKREAAFQHGSRNLKEVWGLGGGPEEEHREAKIALAAEKELSVLMHRNRK